MSSEQGISVLEISFPLSCFPALLHKVVLQYCCDGYSGVRMFRLINF